MTKNKKIIFSAIGVTIIIALASGTLLFAKKASVKSVPVITVSEIANSELPQDASIQGNITSNVSQKVYLKKDMIVKEIFVQPGQEVKPGDKLVEFDMTLVNMELNIENLKKQKLQIDVQRAEKGLLNIKNGGPIQNNLTQINQLPQVGNSNNSNSNAGDEDLISKSNNNILLAYSMMPVFMEKILGTEGSYQEETENEENKDIKDKDNSKDENSIYGSGETYDSEPQGQGQRGQEPVAENDENLNNSFNSSVPPVDIVGHDKKGFDDGNVKYYSLLDSNSIAAGGNGTKDNPFIFLCDSKAGIVKASGYFLNKMAGFSDDGSKVIHPGGYWFQLEFYTDNKINNQEDRMNECIGYYIIDGGLLKKPVDQDSQIFFTLENALRVQTNQDLDGGDFDGSVGFDGGNAGMSRQEAINFQQRTVNTLRNNLFQLDIDIKKLEKRAANQIITSNIDGIVAKVNQDPTSNQQGSPLIVVDSKDGYYIQGQVSELLLDQLKVGTILHCNSYNIGDFDAKVVSVSDVPSGNEGFGGDGMSNPNTSYYSYSATILRKDIKPVENDYIMVNIAGKKQDPNIVILSRAYVKLENGENVVYKDVNGRLKRVVIQGKPSKWGDSLMIYKGLKPTDKIAFPYNKNCKEGARAKVVPFDEFTGEYRGR